MEAIKQTPANEAFLKVVMAARSVGWDVTIEYTNGFVSCIFLGQNAETLENLTGKEYEVFS